MRLSLVIPCYNEAKSLPALVARCEAVFAGENVEVILVDNGSTDETAAVMAGLQGGGPVRWVRISPNRGYGGGILAGLAEAAGDVVGWTHADLQTDPGDALVGLRLFEGERAVMVKGRRFGRPLADVMFTAGMSVFETVLFGRVFWDINAQPTLLPRAHYESWRGAPSDFALDLFAYHQALQAGLRVRRFPVRFGARVHGVSHWNVNWAAKRRFIGRTMRFSLALRRGLRGGGA